jgi:glycosyltransferase involved in cell wall biosynthesis
MKITMIIPTLEFGGAQNITVGIAEEAIKQGHNVDILTFYGKSDYSERLSQGGVNHFCLDYKYSFGLKDILRLKKLSNLLYEAIDYQKPDVIHTHLFLVKLILILGYIKLKVKVVDTQHDLSPWWNSKTFSGRVKTFVECYFANYKANHVVAISNGVKKGVLDNFKLDKSKTSLVYNFVEHNTHKKIVGNHDLFKIIMVSRLDLKKKGLDLCVQIIDYLVNHLQIINLQLDIVGNGPDLVEFKKIVSNKNLDKFFNFLGYQENVYELYAKSDVAILTSRWEGFGLTSAEAALAGLPVVAFNVPGLNEVIVDNHTGFLIADFNVKDFAKAILRLKHDANLRAVFGNNANKRAISKYNKAKVTNSYLKIYEE